MRCTNKHALIMTIPCVSKRQEVYSFHDSYFKIMLKALLGLFNWLADYLHGGWVFETLGFGEPKL